MYNFFVDNNQIKKNRVSIIGQDSKHISNVLRMQKGEKIYVCNKETAERYIAEIISLQKEEVLCNIIEKVDMTELKPNITLFQGLPKSDKMELIIQKAVELGIYEITPVEMKNCIVKIKDENKKIERWQSISEAAAKQSKRTIIPKINGVININKLKEILKEFDLVIIAYEDENKTTIKDVLTKNKVAKKIALIVGPEGGLSFDEVKNLNGENVKVASLGKRILRTETASLAMLSMIIYEYEL